MEGELEPSLVLVGAMCGRDDVVLQCPVPKTVGARPPTIGGPPVGTTFSGEPDDRDAMLTTLRDNIGRLIRQAERADQGAAGTYLRLLDQRRGWICGEMNAAALLSEPPSAPLGIPESTFDLAGLSREPVDSTRKQYERMLADIEAAMSRLWERMLVGEDPDLTP